MDTLEAIFQSIDTETRSGSIGRPVCVRASFVLSADHGKILTALARAAAAAFRWLADQPLDFYASGGVESGHVSILAQGATGTTALVSVALLREKTPTADILLLGDGGTLHHEGEANAPHEDLASSSWNDGDLTPGEKRFLEAIERSLDRRSVVHTGTGEQR